MERMIDSIFTAYQNENFIKLNEISEESGWMMELPSGNEVTRSFLMLQADTIIRLGSNAVPHLFKWVINDNLFIRYIAIFALQQITGLSPYIPYFDKDDKDGNRQKAIKIWNDWWEEQNFKKVIP